MFLFIHSVKNIIRYKNFYLLFGILLIAASVSGKLILGLNGEYSSAAGFLNNLTASNNTDVNEINSIIYSINPRVEVTALLINISRFIIIAISVYTAILCIFMHKKDIGVCRAMGQSRTSIVLCFLTEILTFSFFTAIISSLISFAIYKPVVFLMDKELVEISKIYEINYEFHFTVIFQVLIINASVLLLSSLVLLMYILCRPPASIIKK